MKQGGDRGSSSRARGRAAPGRRGDCPDAGAAGRRRAAAEQLPPAPPGRFRDAAGERDHPHPGAAAFALRDRGVAGRVLRSPARIAVGPGRPPGRRHGFPGPLRGSNASGSFFIEGRPSTDRADQPMRPISARYPADSSRPWAFRISGRTFTEADAAKDAGVGIASLSMARKTGRATTAIGKHVRFENDPKAPWMTIVGIAGDVRQLGARSNRRRRSSTFPTGSSRCRSPMSPSGAVVARQRWRPCCAPRSRGVDPELPFGELTTLQGAIDRSSISRGSGPRCWCRLPPRRSFSPPSASTG